MNYTALYRKFRPASFEDMVGQEHITRTLKNQIIAGRVGHAYLFNGGRGTGKTSSAKILARAINCLNPKDGEPCNECDICKEALNGSLTDIVEMDAASNNGVDDIRQIREEVNFLPTKAKYRVYIIDEVHMLSAGAFNALLKTLEEPPEHVKFILATTEPQKLPATILSRCQRFDFKQISNEDIIKGLKKVCNEMQINATNEALKVIAILAEGGMRDALSILERCLQDGETNIDEDKIKDLVGIPKLKYISGITEAIIDNNSDRAIEIIEEITKDGKDIQNFLWEIIKYVKDLLVYKASRKLELYSEDEMKTIEKISDTTSKERLISIIYELSNIENDMKYSSQKLILFEVGIIRLCSNEIVQQSNTNNSIQISSNNQSENNVNEVQLNSLKYRIDQLEKRINEVNISSISANNKGSFENSTVTNSQKIQTKPKEIAKPIMDIPIGEKLSSWPKIITDLKDSGKIMLYTNLLNSRASKINDLIIGVEFPKGLTTFSKAILEKNENIAELERRVSMECGAPMKIKYIDEAEKKKIIEKMESPIENFAKNMDIPLNIIED